MTGMTDLQDLLRHMEPRLDPQTYVFVSVTAFAGDPRLQPLMQFRETEGTTLILTEQDAAAAGLDGQFRSKRITLTVHSSLDAHGFIAAIATALAGAGIGVNPVAGYCHDHLFVAVDRAEEAMAVLKGLAQRQSE